MFLIGCMWKSVRFHGVGLLHLAPLALGDDTSHPGALILRCSAKPRTLLCDSALLGIPKLTLCMASY